MSAKKVRYLLFLRPAGAQDACRLVRSAPMDPTRAGGYESAHEVQRMETHELHRSIGGRWISIPYEPEGMPVRQIIVATADIQSAEVEVIEE